MGRLTFTQSYASIIPPEELASYTSRAFSLEQLRSELTVPGITYLLALAGTTACGYSKLAPTAPPLEINGPNPAELVRLYVLPDWTGKGIGTTLIKESLDAALEQGYCSCWLRVWRGNERAIRFYRRWGFREVGSEPYNVGKCRETVFLMVRALAASRRALDAASEKTYY
jgi:GNAT superfamily N-acetyltransferase